MMMIPVVFITCRRLQQRVLLYFPPPSVACSRSTTAPVSDHLQCCRVGSAHAASHILPLVRGRQQGICWQEAAALRLIGKVLQEEMKKYSEMNVKNNKEHHRTDKGCRIINILFFRLIWGFPHRPRQREPSGSSIYEHNNLII